MSRTISFTETLEVTVCWCGMNSAMPAELLATARKDGTTSVYCPLGHGGTFGNSENSRLKKRLEAEERAAATRLAQLDQERAAHAATKGQLTKARKRAANGVCPCCNRSFVDVARHVKTKHPTFAQEAS